MMEGKVHTPDLAAAFQLQGSCQLLLAGRNEAFKPLQCYLAPFRSTLLPSIPLSSFQHRNLPIKLCLIILRHTVSVGSKRTVRLESQASVAWRRIDNDCTNCRIGTPFISFSTPLDVRVSLP